MSESSEVIQPPEVTSVRELLLIPFSERWQALGDLAVMRATEMGISGVLARRGLQLGGLKAHVKWYDPEIPHSLGAQALMTQDLERAREVGDYSPEYLAELEAYEQLPIEERKGRYVYAHFDNTSSFRSNIEGSVLGEEIPWKFLRIPGIFEVERSEPILVSKEGIDEWNRYIPRAIEVIDNAKPEDISLYLTIPL